MDQGTGAIPVVEKILIIGGNAAGLTAAARAKRIDPRLNVTVVEKGPVGGQKVQREQAFSEDLELSGKPVFLDEPPGNPSEALKRLGGGGLPFVLDHEDPFSGGRVPHPLHFEHGSSV